MQAVALATGRAIIVLLEVFAAHTSVIVYRPFDWLKSSNTRLIRATRRISTPLTTKSLEFYYGLTAKSDKTKLRREVTR